MKYGIFSDVHGNLPALAAVVNFLNKEQIDKLIFLGDLIGYGGSPTECIKIVKTLKPFLIAGNHEWGALSKFGLGNFNAFARDALLWSRNQLDRDDFAYLETFSLSYEESNFVCVHGSLYKPQEFCYIHSSFDSETSFSLLDRQICFIGHTHRAGGFSFSNNKIEVLRTEAIRLDKDKQYIINIGSVGQPRDRDNRSSFCVYDSKRAIVKFIRLEYNIKEAADNIIAKGLPSILANRLFEGW